MSVVAIHGCSRCENTAGGSQEQPELFRDCLVPEEQGLMSPLKCVVLQCNSMASVKINSWVSKYCCFAALQKRWLLTTLSSDPTAADRGEGFGSH